MKSALKVSPNPTNKRLTRYRVDYRLVFQRVRGQNGEWTSLVTQ